MTGRDDIMMWGMGLGMGLGWIWMLVFWVVVIGGIAWAATRMSSGPYEPSNSFGDARRILDARFARGEIDAEEYRDLRDTLKT
ncbi:MAG: SHOCT domain-containing protein [Nitriliruptoraceae bacterium]